MTILTGAYGSRILRPVLDAAGFGDVETVAVENTFFGGNIAVAGLLTFADLARSAARVPAGRRVLAPEVCLSNGRFLDGGRPEDLPRRSSSSPRTGARSSGRSRADRVAGPRAARPGRRDEPRAGRSADLGRCRGPGEG